MATAEAHVPPQNLEAEESVLGALMVSSGALDAVILDVRLGDDDFYRERHRLVFRAIKRLYERSEAIDAITVSELLRSEGELEEAGGRDAVSHLASVVPVPGNAKHYAEIVKRNALLRRLLAASHTIQQSVNQREGEPRDLVERAEALLFQVAHDERSKDFSRLAEILEFEVDRLEALAKGDLEVTGTPSGFRDLDGVLGGFQPGNLITIAARPSVGKSALVCNIAENVAAKYQLPVAFFSLEMSEAELAHRFIASRSRIPNDRLRKGKVAERDWPRVVRACNQLESAPLWIDESSDLSLLELRAKSRRLAASEGGKLGLVIVDYMQLMRAEDPRANRVEQVGQFSRGLKILARELDVPVIGLSQLSRAPEQRPDKRPMLSDLRESGCLAGDSRVRLPEHDSSTPIGELEGRSGFDVLAVDANSGRLERRRATNAFATGRKEVFALRTSRGGSIRATSNHRFLTVEGWRRLDDLRLGDWIAVPGPESVSSVDWEPVQSIVATGMKEKVYDLTVDGLHSFVAEDIVVHNSIEQDSDVVTFIYRDALYNDEADPSEAELIVAKHRNGPIGKVDVVFLEQYPRFVDRARGGERPIEQKPGEGGPLVDLADEA
jgi:replicative DNA helicase